MHPCATLQQLGEVRCPEQHPAHVTARQLDHEGEEDDEEDDGEDEKDVDGSAEGFGAADQNERHDGPGEEESEREIPA